MKKIIVSFVFFVSGKSANVTKSTILALTLVLSAFSLSAQAALDSYTSDGKELVYSSVSDVTWTKDANLLGTLFATQGFNNVVNAIVAASPTISDTPNLYSPSGTYTLTASDFSNSGATSWYGALAYVNYLNSVNYGGSNQWVLPTVVDARIGYYTPGNGTAHGSEYSELYYQELGSKGYFDVNGNYQSDYGIQDTNSTFKNLQSWSYWSGTEYAKPRGAWYFGTSTGGQFNRDKNYQYFAWAVSPGQIAAVPEPEFAAMLLLGLGLVGFASRRKTKAA